MAFLKFRGTRDVDIEKGQGSYNMHATLARGGVPKKFYGVDNKFGGSSAFAGVAHRGQTVKQLHNLLNDGVSSQIQIKFRDENGEVNTPFPFMGDVWYPGKDGWARLVDSGKLDLEAEIAREREEKTERIMERIRPSDVCAAYLFGYDLPEWKDICRMKGPQLRKTFPGLDISDELAQNDCSLQSIKSLPPNSITQTHCIAKLNLICEYLADTVHEEQLTTIEDTMSNMKDGHNVVSNEQGAFVAEAMGRNRKESISKKMKARNEKNIEDAGKAVEQSNTVDVGVQ